MHVDNPATKELLLRIIQNITSRTALWDDLLQEALIHLWRIEARRPGQTRSWYLQSCKFHLLHYLTSGRSVDAIKRWDSQCSPGRESELEWLGELVDTGESMFSQICARELISMLSRKLQPYEKAVLQCLADGLGAREIGRRLNISHTMVIKHRCRIASLLTNLEPSRNFLKA